MPTTLLKISKASHFFKCTDIHPTVLPVLFKFVKRHIRMDMGQTKPGAPPPMTVFAGATKDRKEFRFHINSWEKFKEHLRIEHIQDIHMEIIHLDRPEYDPIFAKMLPKWVLRPEDQVPAKEYVLAADNGSTLTPARFIGIQTGRGKSITAVAAITEFNCRWITIVKGGYKLKWIEDIVKYSDIKVNEVMLIDSGKELKKFQELCLMPDGLTDVKAIVITLGTMRTWIDDYEMYGDDINQMGYSFSPEDLYKYAKCGMRLIDEVHQEFHMNFRIDLYTNVQRSLSLSATFLTTEPMTERMYKLMHPMETRFAGGELIKYTKSYGVLYNIAFGRKYKTTEFKQTTYSHVAFEKSILKDPQMFYNYANIIKTLVDLGYNRNYQKGDTCVVFAASKDMCGKLVQFFQKAYPQYDIRRYVDEDPYSNLIEPDIRFTTILSGGTAHDIPKLTCGIMSNALRSIQGNVQAFGRLRKLEGRDTNFYFMSCLNIPKHMKYHDEKVQLMKERALSYSQIPYQFTV